MATSESGAERAGERREARIGTPAGWIAALAPPILLAAYPLLALFEQNQTDLPVSMIWSPLLATVAVIAVLYGVLGVAFKSATKASALTSLCVLVFFYWSTFKSDLSGLHLADGWLIILWLALFALVAVALVRTRHNLVTPVLAAGLAGVVLSGAPAVSIATFQADHPPVRATAPRLWPTALSEPSRPAVPRDVYVIIPDDYARSDVLKQYFRYDNSGFIAQLRRRGFVVSDKSRSPYSDSESNIAAELNMGYLDGLARILGSKSQDVRPLKTLIEDNRSARLVKPLGYRYVHIDSDEVTYSAGNPDISSVATPDSFPSLWLEKSVLTLIGGPLGFDKEAANGRFRASIHSAFARLRSVPDRPGPKLVVFHTLMPHDPYIFGAHGQPVTFPDNSDAGLGARLGMSYYLRQVQYIESQLLGTIDAIRARSKLPPVIVIQSDEGFQGNPDTLGEAAMRDIRVKGLLAVSGPGLSGTAVPSPPNSVNTMRFVFNRYFGTHYPMLKSASYPEGDFPYQYNAMRVK